MPTQRCSVVREGSQRCPGVFAFRLDNRPNGTVTACPLCGATHRWDAATEEWVLDPDFLVPS